MKPLSYEANPANLDPRWTHRVDDQLMVVLDMDKVLDFNQFGVAA